MIIYILLGQRKGLLHVLGGIVAANVVAEAIVARVRIPTDRDVRITYKHEEVLELTNKVAPSPASVTLYKDRWVSNADETMWYQEVVVANAEITPYSKVDLQLSAEQVAIFYEKDLAFVAENDNKVVTVYSIGRKPENDYVIQATVSEVKVDGA